MHDASVPRCRVATDVHGPRQPRIHGRRDAAHGVRHHRAARRPHSESRDAAGPRRRGRSGALPRPPRTGTRTGCRVRAAARPVARRVGAAVLYGTWGPAISPTFQAAGLYPAGLADLIADVVNRYTGVWLAAPALVQLESNALDWLRDWMEFPAQTRGLFTTGGSMANFNAVLCAREQHLGPEIRQGVLYGSTQMHHSMIQSARLAGIMPDRVRAVQVDEQFRMDVGGPWPTRLPRIAGSGSDRSASRRRPAPRIRARSIR